MVNPTAPIWEVNHVWLIAIIVILFVGMPKAYTALMTQSFYPIYFVLLGIVLRGSFFTLRKYDPDPGALLGFYHLLFRLSSIIAPIGFGMIVANMISTDTIRQNMLEHIAFQVMVSIFIMALFSYLASLLFIGELQENTDRLYLRHKIYLFFVMTFLSGFIVLLWGHFSGRVSLAQALEPIQVSVQIIATLCIYGIWKALHQDIMWIVRLLGGIQVSAILCGWFAAQYPVIIHNKNNTLLLQDVFTSQHILQTMNILFTIALCLILPALMYLFKVFHQKSN